MSQSVTPAAVPDLDPVAVDRWLKRPRQSSPWLNEEVARRMESRLDWITQRPEHWIHWSPLLGGLAAHARLLARYPEARCQIQGEQVEAASALLEGQARGPGWRRWLDRWTRPTPIADLEPQAADLVWANMVLHLYPRPDEVLKQWLSALRTGGFVMFSCLGPDTLKEWRQWHREEGMAPPAHAMTDMHDWGDMLVETGFAQPVMDMERLTLTYPSAERMIEDLRSWGRNLHRERARRTWSRQERQRWLDRLEAGMPRQTDGQLFLTFELIYGHAIKPAPRVKLAESTAVSLSDMRTLLRQSR